MKLWIKNDVKNGYKAEKWFTVALQHIVTFETISWRDAVIKVEL